MTISGGGGGGDDGGGGRDGGGTEGGDCGGTVGGAEGTDTATATASKVIITSTAAGSVQSGSHAAGTTCVRFFSFCEQRRLHTKPSIIMCAFLHAILLQISECPAPE